VCMYGLCVCVSVCVARQVRRSRDAMRIHHYSCPYALTPISFLPLFFLSQLHCVRPNLPQWHDVCQLGGCAQRCRCDAVLGAEGVGRYSE
jgi:hypothetical protein